MMMCPFCVDEGFNLSALKEHILSGKCVPFNRTAGNDEERQRQKKQQVTGRTKAGNEIGGL